MRQIYTLIISLLVIISGNAQVITNKPAIPIDNKADTITFDASLGNRGLMNYTGDVYAHTGVITNQSESDSDWKYVKAEWSTNIAACKLTKTGTNSYQLIIKPSIREFYQVPQGEKMLKLAFVFRSSDGSVSGRESEDANIYTQVYEEGLNVAFTKPYKLFVFANVSQNIPIEINATGNDSIQLIVDDTRITSSITSSLNHTLTATGTGKHILVAKAYNNGTSKTDTAYYVIKNDTENSPVPTGALNGINYIDNQTVTLVLFAPYKNSVYAIGDFNQWVPDNNSLLKKDGNRFWITLNNLTPGKEYRFQYLIDDSLRIADPYTDKTSDPLDKSIKNTIYPNLLPYPEEKTNGIAAVFQPAQAPYTWQSNSFTPPAKEKLVIYEILIRDFTENHDIKTITDTLHYLKRLGINAVELMPFNEFEGNDSWGYNPSFYFAPDKAYGTKNDYKTFIDECHKNGIAVIMDMVLNHSYGQSPLARMYLEGGKPSSLNPWYNRNHNMQNTAAQWGYDFNHESLYTKKLVDSIASYWMNEYHIDGFRFDFTKGFTNTVYGPTSWASDYDASRIAILKRMAGEIWKRKPDAFVIFEHLAVNLEETELADYGIMLWGNMNGIYGDASMGYLDNNKSDFSGISYKQKGWAQPNLVGYMESHDEERLMVKNIQYGNINGIYNIKNPDTALRRIELAATFFLTVPGPKMIWQFEELGYDVSIDFDGRLSAKPVRWYYYNETNRNRLFNLFRYLIQLKNNEPLFSTSDFAINAGSSIKTVRLSLGSQHAMIVGNFDVTSRSTGVTFPAIGKWFDYFTGDSITLVSADYDISLEPGEYHLYTNMKYSGFPAIPLFNHSVESEKINVFPNPCHDYVFLNNTIEKVHITLQSISGKILLSQDYADYIDLQKYPAGIYFLTLNSKTEKKTFKVVKN